MLASYGYVVIITLLLSLFSVLSVAVVTDVTYMLLTLPKPITYPHNGKKQFSLSVDSSIN